MTTTDEFGAELADFVRRVGELRTARAMPADERLAALNAALLELQHVADSLWPRFEQLAAAGRGAPAADRQEGQLLRALFQRLPLPVALIDRDTVVRRLNAAATGLTGVRAGYTTGRPLAALLTPGDRAAFRSQVAATARGEGARSLVVRLQQRPHEALLTTLSALRPPDGPRVAVLAVFQAGRSSARSSWGPPTPETVRSPRRWPGRTRPTAHWWWRPPVAAPRGSRCGRRTPTASATTCPGPRCSYGPMSPRCCASR
ncbi:PAS domain-containing protein [Streptomyces sp. A5-4]|uniref:PAS domain-containing protein n=1 Tax=Streptomyces sp. A5-4 TaxID=3384771 RepID=UPI003DA801AC